MRALTAFTLEYTVNNKLDAISGCVPHRFDSHVLIAGQMSSRRLWNGSLYQI